MEEVNEAAARADEAPTKQAPKLPEDVPNAWTSPSGRLVRLFPPEDIAIREEVLDLLSTSRLRARLAAIGVCCKPIMTEATYAFDPAAFAGRVATILHNDGWSREDVAFVGDLAIYHLDAAAKAATERVKALGNGSPQSKGPPG